MNDRKSALAVMGNRLNVEPAKLHKTLAQTVFKGASDEEMVALVLVANEYHLNPLTKELYAFPAKGGGIVPVVSVDGWISMANSHPQMDGVEFAFAHTEAGDLNACTCRIFRKDRERPVTVTEYLAECKRNTEPWKQMPSRMLRHKAFKEAARIAFGFSGVTDEDEARDIAANTQAVAQTNGRRRPDVVDVPAEPVDPFADARPMTDEEVETAATESFAAQAAEIEEGLLI